MCPTATKTTPQHVSLQKLQYVVYTAKENDTTRAQNKKCFEKISCFFSSQKKNRKPPYIQVSKKKNPEQTFSSRRSTFTKGKINFPIKANQVWKVIKKNSFGQSNMKNKDLMRAQKGNGSKPSACHDTHYIQYEMHLLYSSAPGRL